MMGARESDGADHRGPQRTAALLASVQLLAGSLCGVCARVMCGHDAVLCLVLGYKHAPRCHACLADHLGEPVADLCERTLQWVQRQECFLRAWQWSSRDEQDDEALRPRCLWPDASPQTDIRATPPAAPSVESEGTPAATWDAGDLGCGDLVLELRVRLKDMAPGTVLALHANDPGAPVDIPAWCGLTGHVLVRAAHPDYWIRRKNERPKTPTPGADR